ncbi:DUF3987 domain-containing protein [Salinarimonas soli]|uniref:DUF3987 domain-containing protein n=1 Tax=Salinarimonas soli TaxID=1638099 RepID=A0A5B2V957_9HYPH|nr:DUF3987 domain-containing protein [Salinarimonas soli]KAA2235554.1 DUF3987 domain-containing protein [Salinarimonas soli]
MNKITPPPPGATINPFRRLWDLGYRRLVPIVPPDADVSPKSTLFKRLDSRGKAVGIRGRDGLWRGFDWLKHETAEEDLDLWFEMGAGVGIRTGDGFVGVDADTYDAAVAEQVRACAEKHFGTLHSRIGRQPKCLYLVRTEPSVSYMRVEFEGSDGKNERVELLAEGRQFVAHGVHPNTRLPYTWPEGIPSLDTVPYAGPAVIEAFFAELRTILPAASPVIREGAGATVNQAALRGRLGDVRAAVEALPNTDELFPTRDAFRDVGYSIKAALPDDQEEALELYQRWAAGWVGPKGEANDPAYVEAEWRRFKPPYKIGAPWLFELTERVTGGRFDRAKVWFDEVDDEIGDEAARSGGSNGMGTWPEPLDIFGDADPAELTNPPSGSLPTIIERWARSEARRKGTSMAFAAAAGVAAAAGAIGASLRIQVRARDGGWMEPASFWTVLVADPGSAKSAIVRAALAPLRELDAEWRRVYQAAHAAWTLRAKVKRSKEAVTEAGPEPKPRRIFVDDTTMEAQIRLHRDNPRGLMRSTDELSGMLDTLGAYKRNGGGDRSHMLRLFDGDEIGTDRVGAGAAFASSALMGVLAGTQPEKLRQLVRDLEADGMLQRFVFILDDGCDREGVDEEEDHDALGEYRAALRGLAIAGVRSTGPVRISSGAHEELAAFWHDVRRLQHLPGASGAWKGHLSKWGKLLPRIVLTFHALEQWSVFGGVLPDTEVDRDTANRAAAFARFLLKHSLFFYEEYFGGSQAASEAVAIAGYLLTRPGLTEVKRRDIYHARPNLKGEANRRALLAAMAELEQADWCAASDQRDVQGPKFWRVNPLIHVRFAARGERERRERGRRRELIIEAGAARRALVASCENVSLPRDIR